MSSRSGSARPGASRLVTVGSLVAILIAGGAAALVNTRSPGNPNTGASEATTDTSVTGFAFTVVNVDGTVSTITQDQYNDLLAQGVLSVAPSGETVITDTGAVVSAVDTSTDATINVAVAATDATRKNKSSAETPTVAPATGAPASPTTSITPATPTTPAKPTVPVAPVVSTPAPIAPPNSISRDDDDDDSEHHDSERDEHDDGEFDDD